MKTERGFTVIELLVVIAIIAILASMVLPARLWTFNWHRDYKPPEKRPGLK